MADPVEILGLRPGLLDDYDGQPVGGRPDAPALRATTAVGALLAGFLLVAGVAASVAADDVQDARKDDLIALITDRQQRAEALGEELEELRAQVAAAEDLAAGGVPALSPRVAALEAAAGLAGLRGPGLRLSLADAAGECATGRPEDCRIQDVDVQLAANLLFSAGAEGVAVNGERLIATSAIRSAGGSILVNYRVLTSPYVLEAVGDASALRRAVEASELADDFGAWTRDYGLGFVVTPADDVELPAYRGSVRLRSAAPAGPTVSVDPA